jgi:hypothetical protein
MRERRMSAADKGKPVNLKSNTLTPVLLLLLLTSPAATAAILSVCQNTATLRGDATGLYSDTQNVWSAPSGAWGSGVFARGETPSPDYTSNSLSGLKLCTYCSEAYMTSLLASALANGHYLPNRFSGGPLTRLKSVIYQEQIQQGVIHNGVVTRPHVIRRLHFSITKVEGCPAQCQLLGDTTLDFGEVTSSLLPGRRLNLSSVVTCTSDANVRVTFTNIGGADSIEMGTSLRGDLRVGGNRGSEGMVYRVGGNTNVPITPSVTLNTTGNVPPGKYSASAILTVSIQ